MHPFFMNFVLNGSLSPAFSNASRANSSFMPSSSKSIRPAAPQTHSGQHYPYRHPAALRRLSLLPVYREKSESIASAFFKYLKIARRAASI